MTETTGLFPPILSTTMVIRGCLRGVNEFATPSSQEVMAHSQTLQSRNGGDIVGALTVLARQ